LQHLPQFDRTRELHVGACHVDREEDARRGYPFGILVYPLVVLALVLLFRRRLEIAAVGWAYLAFGDGCATLAGVLAGGPRLPWNAKKSWSGFAAYVVCGTLAGAFLLSFVSRVPASRFALAAVLAGALAGALFESLPSEIDDNLVAPLVGAAAFAALLPGSVARLDLAGERLLPALAVNVAAPALAVALRVIRPSGALAGGLLGAALWICGGPKLYALLWLFFLLGTATTRYGKARKEAMGKAEIAGGRRGVANVLANGVAPLFFALAALVRDPAWPWLLAAAAALATAAMDTVGTEIGQAVRSTTVLLPDFRRVSPGTDGAVSTVGTLAGLAAALLVGAAGAALLLYPPAGALAVLAGAIAGTILESLLGRAGAPWRVANGHVLNLYNTVAGGLVALLLARIGGLG
jgi:uncharacterized protein (TIGR00297 family)